MKSNKLIFISSIIILIILVVMLILGVFNNKANLIELNVDEVIEKVNNKDSFVLCISQTTCSHCASYKPKLEKISKDYGIEIFYIDIDKYSNEKQQEFKKHVSFDKSTPVTAFIKNGEEATASNRIFGDVSYDKIVTKLKNNGFISE